MNTTQIKCFLTVAETLNFTKAAQQLFMTQPGLSRYIVSLERELNVLLFIRDRQHVRLTPAGALLAREMSDFENRLSAIITKVQKIGEGYSGHLSIGSLEGQWMQEDLTDKYSDFIRKNPNINVEFRQGSFRNLREWLSLDEIDIALTIEFDIQNVNGVLYERYKKDYPLLAISKHRLFEQKKESTIDELLKEPVIVISPDDSRAGYELVMKTLRSMGINTRNIRQAPNFATQMLLIEAGQGVGIINSDSSIAHKDSVITAPLHEDTSASTCIAWMRSNYNPAISLFLEEFKILPTH